MTSQDSKSNAKPVRAFIIGDEESGLTIVITDPVMVVHYSKDDLTDPNTNQMSSKEPIVSMAAVVQELLPMLRGVDVDAMRQRETEIRQSAHGKYSLEEEEKLFGELDRARTIGQIIRNNGSVYDVDFCLALDIDPCEIVARGRSTGPAVQIKEYLTKYGDCADPAQKTVPAHPGVFNITSLPTENLAPPERWEDPREGGAT